MTDTMTFEGRKEQIIKQLTQYMNQDDAKKFFTVYFNQGFTQSGVIIHRAFRYSSAMARKARGSASKNPYVGSYPKARKCLDRRNRSSNIYKSIKHCKLKQKLTTEDIENTSFVIGNSKRKYLKIFSKATFIAMAVALDITLCCTIGFSFIGTAITAIVSVIDLPLQKEKDLAACIISIVRKQKSLPKHSSFIRSNCKNYNLECDWHKGNKCGITIDAYIAIINKLVKQKVLIVE